MAPSFSRVSSGALLFALAYNARPVNADFWEDVDNCKLVLDDLPADLTSDFCHDWTYGYEPEYEYVTVTGYPVTVTEYPDAKTCEGEGYSTTTKYPEPTPESSTDYQSSQPTPTWESSTAPESSSDSTSVPGDSTTAPNDSTTAAPDQTSATDVPGGADVTVTSTIYTTYWTTSTIYEGYPEATPAPVYRRQVAALKQRATWCIDRPCRLVQYDDETIFEACKKYLGWKPETKTKWIPGYTVTVTSYPTDCKKHDDGYKPDPYPTKEEYKPDPYPTKQEEYKPEYPAETAYPEKEYPEKEYPDHDSKPYPAPYPENEPAYDEHYDDSYDEHYDDSYDKHYEDGYGGSDHHDDDYYEDDSDYKQPWENDFDNNYSGPDGPKPWDDNQQTSELADAIEAGGYDHATEESGLDDAPWNALPADYPPGWKREESYKGYGKDEKSYEEDSGDYDVVWVDENGYPIEDEKSYEPSKHDSYKPDSYKPDSYKPDDKKDDSYPKEYAPNLYGPDVGEEEESYEHDDSYDHPDGPWGSSDDHYDEYSKWSLPKSSEYEGDEYESDYGAPADDPSYGSSWGEDGVDY
ncbi:hypothetical protein SVAN01_10672 [Stagonosporopsis vannaccii]|nr:hypothetical protein SVAN01_10672 [Stagonosporopsis vannaccii]